MQRFEKKQLSTARRVLFSSTVSVRFQDIDAAGIAFFARIFDYVHIAYEELLESAGHPLPRVIAEKRWAAPLRHAEADYLVPCRFGDSLQVQLVGAAVEESEISLGWRLVEDAVVTGEVRPRALVQTVHTFVSLPSFERRPVPDEICAKLK